MAWRLARSLTVLSGEIRAMSPAATIWDIGDPAHAASASDHNPNAAGVVCAIDIVDDDRLDLADIAERIRARRHPAFKYVIHNRRIASVKTGYAWVAYGGTNPHTGHVHVSVGIGPDGQSTGPYDNTEPWNVEDEMDSVQAGQLAAAHWTLTAIDDGDGGRIALHQWASRIGSSVAALEAAVDELVTRESAPVTLSLADRDAIVAQLVEQLRRPIVVELAGRAHLGDELAGRVTP